jgi:hypothetical protein
VMVLATRITGSSTVVGPAEGGTRWRMMTAGSGAHRAAPQQAVIPAHAGIQYAAISRFDHERLGLLGRPVKCSFRTDHSPAMTAENVARHRFTFQTAKFVIASSCEAIYAATKAHRAAPQKIVIPRARGGTSNTRRRVSISGACDYWVARSSRAMTAESGARHGFTFQTANHVIASVSEQSMPQGRMDCFVASRARVCDDRETPPSLGRDKIWVAMQR